MERPRYERRAASSPQIPTPIPLAGIAGLGARGNVNVVQKHCTMPCSPERDSARAERAQRAMSAAKSDERSEKRVRSAVEWSSQ